MKRLFPLVPLLLLAPVASAAPRVWAHDGYTRAVFDLPRVTTATTSVKGQTVTVKLGLSLPAAAGKLTVRGLSAYSVSGDTVTLTLTAGFAGARVEVLPAAGGQPARLVIDALRAGTPPAPAAAPKPAAAVTRPASTAKVMRPRVVLDPGHGGNDPGMQSRWVQEAAVNLDVALRVRRELQAHGVDVVMTRETDRHLHPNKALDLDARSRLAKTDEAAAFISIHVNASTNPAAHGVETYYFGQPMPGRSRSLAIQENGGGSIGQQLTQQATNSAQNLLGDLLAQAKLSFSRQLAEKVQANLVKATGALNRGVLTDAFYVIRNPTTPAILIEIGFGSNPVEGAKLSQEAYRERIAVAIARAILDFLNTR
ncbi:N-acetylmuramoyl-L-alanine amidase [Deinococcus sp. RL]|uniref:N-acetylmuramoyl-L-alanine amidase family protein n=1 Tax=Deinococcus sp. RL TaxID=1489678 RepID=UPI0004DA5E00|nr:N-acetylmuramoyl-L-alanine amidase [Deinococcus sp. RL]KEF35157.1 N-acetylmuramoyl-L-alanine amidase [Deinococcus sp. RL]